MAIFWYCGGSNGSVYRLDRNAAVSEEKLRELRAKYLHGIKFDTFSSVTTDLKYIVREFMVPPGTCRTAQWKKFKNELDSL